MLIANLRSFSLPGPKRPKCSTIVGTPASMPTNLEIDSSAGCSQLSRTRYRPPASEPNCRDGQTARSCMGSVSRSARGHPRPDGSVTILRTLKPSRCSNSSSAGLSTRRFVDNVCHASSNVAACAASSSDSSSKLTPAIRSRAEAAWTTARTCGMIRGLDGVVDCAYSRHEILEWIVRCGGRGDGFSLLGPDPSIRWRSGCLPRR